MALIGYGAIASAVHLPLLRRIRGARLVAVADPSPDARRRAQRAGVSVEADSARVIDRADVDAVVVCTPSALHAGVATAAAAAGRHVYIEKPIATNLTDAIGVVDAASEAGVVAAVGFNRRFHPLLREAHQVLRRGELGTVRSASCAFGEPIPLPSMPEWKRRRRTGGGVLLDLASHHIDLLRWLLDIEVAEVEASLGSELSEGDTARLRLRTSSGVLAEGFFSFRDTRADWLEFVGDLGRLRVDRYGWAIELRRQIGRSSTRTRLPPVWEPTSWRMRKLLRPQHDPSWRCALTAFIGRILGNSCELPGPIDGLRSLEVVLAAEQSARLSAPVTPAAVSAL